MCFGEEKMRFSIEEMLFYRLQIRYKTENAAESNQENVEVLRGMTSIEGQYRKSSSTGAIYGRSSSQKGLLSFESP